MTESSTLLHVRLVSGESFDVSVPPIAVAQLRDAYAAIGRHLSISQDRLRLIFMGRTFPPASDDSAGALLSSFGVGDDAVIHAVIRSEEQAAERGAAAAAAATPSAHPQVRVCAV